MKIIIVGPESASSQPSSPAEFLPLDSVSAGPRAGGLYRMHGLRLLDRAGDQVGYVDWIWASDFSGQAEFIGTRLNWLRGSVRVVPATGSRVNLETSTIQIAYDRDQVKRACRRSIAQPLSAEEKRNIWAQYAPRPQAPGSVAETSGSSWQPVRSLVRW